MNKLIEHTDKILLITSVIFALGINFNTLLSIKNDYMPKNEIELKLENFKILLDNIKEEQKEIKNILLKERGLALYD